MERREFFEKGGCGLAAFWLAALGLSACEKKESGTPDLAATAEPVVTEEKKAAVRKMIIEKMGKSEEEADAMIAEFMDKLPMVRKMCICKGCPSYVADESELGFCHPLIGKSAKITEERGCVCPSCPVYGEMGMKHGYYCTRMSELEQEAART